MSASVSAGSSSVVFPSEGHQVLSTLVHLLGCSVLSFCFARRLEWSSLSKFCTMAIFIDSWLFVFSGGVVVSGVGMSLSDGSCLSGVYLCIVFYGTSKMLIYIFLAEKVHHVWSAGIPIRRFQSRIWILCAVVLFGYVAIFILMFIGRIGYLDQADSDGKRTCIIGLEPMASIPLLSYDVFLNIFLTSLFAYPLLGGNFWGLGRRGKGTERGDHVNLQGGRKLSNPKLRALAKRTCYAAAVALGTSVVNILILTILHGRQLGWVCLASCGFDVTVNAIVIFLITRKVHSDDPPSGIHKPNRAPRFAPVISAFDKEPLEFPNHIVLTNHADATYITSGETSGNDQSASSRPNPNRQPYSPGRARAVASPKHRRGPTSPPHGRSQSPNPHGHGLHAHGVFRNNTTSTKRTHPSKGGHGEVDSHPATLSQIGDFAITRNDNGDGVCTMETGTGISFASMGGLSVKRTSHAYSRRDGAAVVEGTSPDGNDAALQVVPVLLHNAGHGQESRGMTTSISLEDLQEEAELRTPGSMAKMRTLEEDDVLRK